MSRSVLLRLTLGALVLLWASASPAEWQRIPKFKGIALDVYPSAAQYAFARQSTGWTISPTGELRRLSWTRSPLGSMPVGDIYGIGPYPNTNLPGVTMIVDGTPYAYDFIHNTFSTIAATPDVDSGYVYRSDSLLHRADSINGSRWLELTLSTASNFSFDGTPTPIIGFYNDHTARFTDSVIFSDSLLDSMIWSYGGSGIAIDNTYGPPGMIEANDTVFVVDGSVGETFKYITADTAGTFAYPTYVANGDIDTAYIASTVLYVKIDTTGMTGSAAVMADITKYVILLSIDDNPNGIPFTIIAKSISGSVATLSLRADSAYFANHVGFDVDSASYVMFKPSAAQLRATVICDEDYLGVYGGVQYATFTPSRFRYQFGYTAASGYSDTIPIQSRQVGIAGISPDSNCTADSVYVELYFTNILADQYLRCALYTWDGLSGTPSVSTSCYRVDTTNHVYGYNRPDKYTPTVWVGFKFLGGANLYADSTYCLQVMSSNTITTGRVAIYRTFSLGDTMTYLNSSTTWQDSVYFGVSPTMAVAIYGTRLSGQRYEIPGVSKQRDFDCRMMRGGTISPGQKYGQLRLQESGGQLKFYGWSQTSSFAAADQGNVALSIYENPRLAAPAPGSPPSNYGCNIACLHRYRAFYAGNPSYPYRLYWTADNDYDNIAGGSSEDFEGDKQIRALVSHGGDLFIGFRHQLQALQGSSTSDFYFIPAPANVGCVSQASVVLNPSDNCLYFINELGLWRRCPGGGAEPVNCKFASLFSDSVYWRDEKLFHAVIFNDKYWVTMQFKNPVGSWRLLTFDLTNNGEPELTFIDKPGAAFLYVAKYPSGGLLGYPRTLYAGAADSTILYRLNEEHTYTGNPYGGRDEVYCLSTYRSNWIEGADRENQKRVLEYELSYTTGAPNDIVRVDFFRNYNNAAVWTDTLITSGGHGTVRRPVSRKVAGQAISFGFRCSDSAAVMHDMSLNIIESGRRRMH